MKVKVKNPVLRVLIVVILSVIIFNLAGIIASIIIELSEIPEEYINELFQGVLFILAIVFSLIFTKGKLSEHGYKLPKKAPYLQILLVIFIFEVISYTAIAIAPITGEGHFAKEFTFIREVLTIWLLASTGEELLTRGFIQGYLQPLSHLGIKIRKLSLSLPVIVSAFLFMAMHIPLIFMGMDVVLFSIILPSTFIVGIIAGYYREKTGSLVPAIMVHMLANIFPVIFANILGLF